MIYEKGYDEDLKRRQEERRRQLMIGKCPECRGTKIKNGQKCPKCKG